MISLLKIDCVMYRVKDLQKSLLFYENLGVTKRWEDKDKKMIGFTFPESDSEIVIHTNQEIPDFDICYSVSNVVDACREFKENGYTVLIGPIDVRTGKYAVLEDLDGHKIPIIDLTSFGNVARYDK
jgi:catechol 2,3-dioxygenase-like lactoylglutathione lyase family enzyme